MFEELSGDQICLVIGGVYVPCPVFQRPNGDLFARYKGGYVRLYANGATSKDRLKVEVLHTERPLFVDKFGRLGLIAGPGREALPHAATLALTGADEK